MPVRSMKRRIRAKAVVRASAASPGHDAIEGGRSSSYSHRSSCGLTSRRRVVQCAARGGHARAIGGDPRRGGGRSRGDVLLDASRRERCSERGGLLRYLELRDDDSARTPEGIRQCGAADPRGCRRLRTGHRRPTGCDEQHRGAGLVGSWHAPPHRPAHVTHRRSTGRPAPAAHSRRPGPRERAQARRDRGPAGGPEDLALNERCLSWSTAGPPMLPGVYNNNVEFIQTHEYVAIVNEMIHDVRIIPMDGRPHGTVRRWLGDSRGRWEGQTLVVDTTNFTDKTSVRGSDDRLHLVERFTPIDTKTIEYQFTVDDPTVWSQPWTARFPLRKTSDRMYEYACHEGNAPSVEGILRASRAQERQ